MALHNIVAVLLLVLAGSVAAAARPMDKPEKGKGHVKSNKQDLWDPTVVGVINGSRPLVIAHRGASGTLPEHTLEGYRLAIEQGADCIECDVVVTKDLKLICRHEPWLQNTTDALQKFADREKTYNFPEAGGDIKGIFSIDLTLAEIKQLRAAQAFYFRDQSYNYKFEVPTFEEYVKVATSKDNDKVVCIYPETKHPTFFNDHPVLKAAKTTIDDLLAAEMARLGYDLKAPFGSPKWLKQPAFIQSFEQNNLRYWKSKTALPVVHLVDSRPPVDTNTPVEYLLSEAGIKEISEYAWGYAPWKGLYIRTDATNSIIEVNLKPVQLAAKYGMPTTVWTLRNEPRYLAKQYRNDPTNEYNLIFNVAGVVAGFTDFPETLADWVQDTYNSDN